MQHLDRRPKTEVTTRTLPRGYYADPDYFKRELEKVHYDMWLYAGPADDLPDPGSYVVRQIADAGVLLVRDEEGEIRAFHNVCRHRGTLLCTEAQGQFPSTIQCRYHAWTYRLDGTLKKATHMENVTGFREADWPLNPVHLARWGNLLFINLAPHPIPLREHLDGLDERFRNWDLDILKCVERRSYSLRANWKLVVQNYHECLHCPTAHPQLQKISHYMSGDNELPRPTWLGARMELGAGMTTLTASGRTTRQPLPRLDEEERRHIYYYALLPNMLINLHPDYVLTFMFNPVAVNQTEITCHWLMHPDEIARSAFDPSDAVEFWDLTNQQDWGLSDLAQAGISSRGYRPGPYSNREELLMALDRWLLARVGEL